ncbi:MAG: hypothetical protein IJY42_02670 [Clostridia bacterium]|nr:hypothetical protein [Clostridia bacterium]
MFTNNNQTTMPEKQVRFRYVAEVEALETEELGAYISHGIRVIRVEETPVSFVSDVSTDGEEVRRLAELCTLRELDPEHLPDVIENFLNDVELDLV